MPLSHFAWILDVQTFLVTNGTPEGKRHNTTAKNGLLSHNYAAPMVAGGDSVSIGILVEAVVEEAIWVPMYAVVSFLAC